jgi:hypothetical protein
MKPQVFISYKSQNRNLADPLRSQLESWGYLTWMDVYNIPTGAYFREAIQKGLESSQVITGIVTPEAVASYEVMWEWDYGIYESRLIPLLYQKFPLPYHLRGIQHIDFTENINVGYDKLRKVLDSVTQTIQSPSQEEPASPSQPANWKNAVKSAIHRVTSRKGSRLFIRAELVDQELDRIVLETHSAGATPAQTMSRILQELRDEGFIRFTQFRGEYELIE